MREKPFPNIHPDYNQSVMDINLNDYDTKFVKPLSDKLDNIKPLKFARADGSSVDVEVIRFTDESKVSYSEPTKTLTLKNGTRR